MKLLSREKVNGVLDKTEGLSFLHSGGGRIQFEQKGDDVDVLYDKKRYRMTDDAFVKAARVVGVPATYVNKIPKELFVPHLSFWYGNGRSEDFQLVCRGDEVISVTKRNVEFVSNQELLSKVEEGIGQKEIKGYAYVTNNLSYTSVDIVGNKDFEALIGGTPKDLLFGGVRVQNSVLGENPIEVSAFIFRQVCSNGAVAPRFLYKWSRRNREQKVAGWAKDVATQAYAEVEQEFCRIKELVSIKVEGFVSPAIKSFFRDWGVPVTLREEIMSELVDSEHADTLYDIWCAVSKVATHSQRVIDNPLLRNRMMLMAGDVAENPNLCEKCHQKV